MRRKKKIDPNSNTMDRKEIAVWLGRVMSTSDVTLRVVMQLLDVIMLQQHTIQMVARHLTDSGLIAQNNETLEKIEAGSSSNIIEQLAKIHTDMEPVLQAVDDSCQKLQEMI